MLRTLLMVAVFLIPGIARAHWYEAGTSHFRVYSDEFPERLKAFATNLERFDRMLRFVRNVPEDPVGSANRVTVYVVSSQSAIERLIGTSGVAGFYVPRAGDSVAFVPQSSGSRDEMDLSPQAILLHEYSHHFLLSASPDAAFPGWFVEGYAEFFAPATFARDGGVTIGNPPMYRSYGLSIGNSMPLEKLLTADTRKLTTVQLDALYGRGWLLMHYFYLSGKRDGQLTNYLVALNTGKSPLEAGKAFGDLHGFDRELETYMSHLLPTRVIAASALPIGPVTLRRLTDGEDATMDVRIRSERGVDKKTAPLVYADAQKAAAPFANDRGAQIELAEAAFDAEDYAATETAAARALAADPKSVDALLYQARAKMAEAEKAKDTSAATWSAIRRLITAANRLDTENPLPLILYYRSFVQSGAPVPKAAKDGLYYAYVLAPQDRGLRFEAATAYLQDGDARNARSLLAPLAYDPHAGERAKLAATLVAEIDAGHPDAALADLAKEAKEKDSDKPAPPSGKNGSDKN